MNNPDEFAELIQAALKAQHRLGLATGKFFYDHTTPEAELTEAKKAAQVAAHKAVVALWSSFYDEASVPSD